MDKLDRAILEHLQQDASLSVGELAELEGIFRFNDAVLRHLTVRRQDAVVEQSVMLKAKEEKDRSSRDHAERRAAREQHERQPRSRT